MIFRSKGQKKKRKMKGKMKSDIKVEGSGEMKRYGREKGWRSVNIKKINVKKIGKLERKKIMTLMLTWLNWSVVTINTTLQLLDIYR